MKGCSENEIKSWLQSALKNENLKSFDVKIAGNSEKGDGYAADVIFVTVTGNETKGVSKEYNLVLKCSKTSAALLEKSGIRDAYVREVYYYDKIFPAFTQFQLDRGIKNPFDSIPKCYGVYNSETMQIVVMQNLKKAGYSLWDLKKPLTRKHIDMVVKEYGKYHAVSIAMKEQEPEKFQQLLEGIKFDVMKNFFETTKFEDVLRNNIEETTNMFKNDLPDSVLNKWSAFKEKIRFIFCELGPTQDELQVITHGDCWNNNFMYKYDKDQSVSRAAILDWQIGKLSSPVLDLSYFIFSAISGEDIDNINEILKSYYDSFSNHLLKMGSTFSKTYSFQTFLQEWKKYSKFGIMMCQMPFKMAFTAKEDLPDIAESAEKGEDLLGSFDIKLKDATEYKNRLRPIIQHAVKFELI